MKPILKLQDASKIYRQGGVKTVGIEAVNLEIYPHDFVAITGRSGCGKSTLLNILGCMDELTSGSYFFDGQSRLFPIRAQPHPAIWYSWTRIEYVTAKNYNYRPP